MTTPSAGSKKPVVFISYSSTPPSNVEFVRDLANRLRRAGFEVWLDEEQLPPGERIPHLIRDAIQKCDAALLVVNSEWLTKDWTQYEGELLCDCGKNPLKVHREQVDARLLSPRLYPLKHVDWHAGDPDVDARFWQVYCGLQHQSPGERRYWADNGRRLVEGMEPPSKSPDPLQAASDEFPSVDLTRPMSSAPVLVRSGTRGTYLLTDDRRWRHVDLNAGTIKPLRSPDGTVADAVLFEDRLVVSLYQPKLARLNDKTWEYDNLSAVVLKLMPSEIGLVAGDASGRIAHIDGSASRTLASLDEPVVDLAGYDGGFVALGANGTLARAPLASSRDIAATPIDCEPLGRPVELFDAGSPSRVGVLSDDRVGILQVTMDWTWQASPPLEDGVDRVASFGARGLLAAVTFGGELWHVDLVKGAVSHVPLPRHATVAGAVRGPGGTVWVWTTSGALYVVHHNLTIRDMSQHDVVAVETECGQAGKALVFRRTDDGDVTVKLIKA